MAKFDISEKSSLPYIDYAANGNGDEKASFFLRALHRTAHKSQAPIHALEIGPGGGSALHAVSDALSKGDILDNSSLHVSLLEVDGVESKSLEKVRQAMAGYATTSFHQGNAEFLDEKFSNELDVVSASAVMHEVYSYGDGYQSIDNTVGAITNSLRPGGFFAYRDVFSVDRLSQHERARHLYDKESWVTFIKMFLPYYLGHAIHPYHRQDDRFIFEQNSKRIDVNDINKETILSVDAPVGLLREIQRHYITLRDHAWRSGVLGVMPVLEGAAASDWIDLKRGHKRVHFEVGDGDCDPLIECLSEDGPKGRRTIDGDIFDRATDELLVKFLSGAEADDESVYGNVWNEWLRREGSETYTYMTLNTLLGSVALQSFAESNSEKILLPTEFTDVSFIPRNYYNRFLKSTLSNPLQDGKQLVLFENIDITNTAKGDSREKSLQALEILKKHCSRETIAAVYTPLRKLFA